MPTSPANPEPDAPTVVNADGHAGAPARWERSEDGVRRPFLVWSFVEARRAVSSAPVGGGIGERDWILNAQVRSGYARHDLDVHLAELAALAGLPAGRGIGMLTAADVTGAVPAVDGGVTALATVGVRVPTWAAAPDHRPDSAIDPETARSIATPAGTINVVVEVPVPLSDAALVNLVATATEAKTQALFEVGIAGTGTATDVVAVVCPRPVTGAGVEPFGGPRSVWGARAARAVHSSVRAGVGGSLRIIGRGDR